jgi:iron complex transport system ATP-binding protein
MTADELRGAGGAVRIGGAAAGSSVGAGDPPAYEVRGLEVTLGGQLVLGPLDLEIARGAFMGILGPNGSGKTTLLRALTGGVKPSAGSVALEGRPPGAYRAVELARLVGVVPQQFSLDFNFTVAEMVAMGRYSHSGRGVAGAAAAADGEAVAAALEATSLTSLSDRLVTELSGGERQRALIAQTLAQETPILLLDEPLNNLDLNHQLEIMQLLGRLHARGKTVVVVLHDLNMAAQYCNELLLLDHGRVAARGTPGDILDPRLILEVFRVRVAVHRQGQRPYLTPLWSKSREELVEQGTARVHVIAGGGAASELVEELVLYGFTPSVGVVSVFDTDYATAQRYELHVISAPPFQPFPPEAVQQLEAVVEQAQVVAVAPIFFGPGNLEPLRVALRAARAGKLVVLVDEPPIAQRDLSGGEATRLVGELIASGAVLAGNTAEIVEKIRRSAVS